MSPARSPGYADGVTVSNAVGATAGGALQATVQPTITGTAEVGSTPSAVDRHLVAAVADRSSTSGCATGAPIPNATGSTYRLTPEDAGKNISVTVLATKTGLHRRFGHRARPWPSPR